MPQKNPVTHQRVPALAALSFAVWLLLAGCGSTSATHTTGPAGATSNPTCQAVATAYASFLAGYTPTTGGDWQGFDTALTNAVKGANASSVITLDVGRLYFAVESIVSDISQGGSDNSVNASTLQPVDDALQSVAKDCGITLTAPTPDPGVQSSGELSVRPRSQAVNDSHEAPATS